MQKSEVTLPQKKLIGISIRTNNQTEIDPMTGKIFPCINRYYTVAEKIPHKIKAGTTLCVYTNYESDHRGDYTYFIGEEVSSFEDCPKELETLIIPEQTYTKFTNGPAPMPQVVRESWFKIWQMSEQELLGKRNYAADFEVYDERALDHENTVLDIFIGRS